MGPASDEGPRGGPRPATLQHDLHGSFDDVVGGVAVVPLAQDRVVAGELDEVHVGPHLLDDLVPRLLGHAGEQGQRLDAFGRRGHHELEAALVALNQVGPLGHGFFLRASSAR